MRFLTLAGTAVMTALHRGITGLIGRHGRVAGYDRCGSRDAVERGMT